MKRPERPFVAPPALAAILAVLAVLVPVLSAGPPTARAAVSGSGSQASSAPPKDPKKIRSQLAAIADAYAKSEADEAALHDRARALRKRQKATGERLARTRERIAQTATAAYMNGADTSTLGLFAGGSSTGGSSGTGGSGRRGDAADDVISKMTSLAVLGDTNDAALRDANRDRAALKRQQDQLAGTRKKLKQTRRDLAAKKRVLNKALLAAAKRAAERANRGSGRGPKMSSGGACPVGHPFTLTHTFGAPRSGGRSHEGTDIPAPKGTPIYAVEDGTISRAYSNTLGGIAIILKGEGGDSYYYAHQEVNLVHTGQRVVAGQQIAKVGMTGDAMGTIYHLHFELWPNGGSAIDSYPMLFALCGKSG